MYVSKLRRNLISLGILEIEGFTVKMQPGKIKVIKGSLVVLSGTRRDNYVYTLDGQVVTRKTLKGRKQLGEYQTGWKINRSSLSTIYWVEDTTKSTYLVNRSQSSAIRFKTPIDMLRFFGWLANIKQGMLELVKVVLYKNMGSNESEEYKKNFIGSGVGTGSMQVRLTLGVKSCGTIYFQNYPSYSSASCLQGLLVVGDHMGLRESIATTH
ncbi:hypothetical protein Tco_1429170 [Tanacetum coccineum]